MVDTSNWPIRNYWLHCPQGWKPFRIKSKAPPSLKDVQWFAGIPDESQWFELYEDKNGVRVLLKGRAGG